MKGWRINRALIDRMGVISDFRRPDNIRIGVCPMSTTFAELHAAVATLHKGVVERLYEKYSAEASGVT
jgi:kynureninase